MILVLLLLNSLYTTVHSGDVELLSAERQTIFKESNVVCSWKILKDEAVVLIQKLSEISLSGRELILKGNGSAIVLQNSFSKYNIKTEVRGDKYFIHVKNITDDVIFELEVLFFVVDGDDFMMTYMAKKNFTVLTKERTRPPVITSTDKVTLPNDEYSKMRKIQQTKKAVDFNVKEKQNKKNTAFYTSTLFLTICSVVAGCLLTITFLIIVYYSCNKKQEIPKNSLNHIEHNVKQRNLYSRPETTLFGEELSPNDEEFTIPFNITNQSVLQENNFSSNHKTFAEECYYMVPKNTPIVTYEEIPLNKCEDQYANMSAARSIYANL